MTKIRERHNADDLEVVDSSGLMDADWTEIKKLQKVYKSGSRKAFAVALEQLAKDPIRYAVVMGAFFPDMIRETIRDKLAELGITDDDLRDLIRKLEGVPDRMH